MNVRGIFKRTLNVITPKLFCIIYLITRCLRRADVVAAAAWYANQCDARMFAKYVFLINTRANVCEHFRLVRLYNTYSSLS